MSKKRSFCSDSEHYEQAHERKSKISILSTTSSDK